jgi:carboxyl-terminal processing protease
MEKANQIVGTFFDRAFESSRKKINGVEVNEDKDLTEDSQDSETINFDDSDKTVKENSKDDKTKTVELEKETRESAKKSLDEYFGFMNDLDRDDWFSVYIIHHLRL